MIKRLLLALALLASCAGPAHGQATVQLTPESQAQYFDNNGDVLSFGKVCTYITGTNTPQATYTDHTGVSQNTNPVVLDISGRANIWWDIALVYRVVLREAGTTTDCTTGAVIYTVDGIKAASGIGTVGNLPPLFTTSISGTTLSFALSSAGAHTVFGNNSGSGGAPSYGGIGIDTQIAYNVGGTTEVGSSSLTYNSSTRTFAFGDAGSAIVRLVAGVAGGQAEIHFNGSATPAIVNVTDWEFRPTNSQDVAISWGACALCAVFTSTGGAGGGAYGELEMGQGAFNGQLLLNDGNQMAGTLFGPKVIAGSQADPNSVYTAEQGSLYLSTAGGSMTTLWVKEVGSNNMGWVAK